FSTKLRGRSNSSVFNCRAPCALRRIEGDHTAIQFPKLAENLTTPCATTNQTYFHEIYSVLWSFDLNLQRCFQPSAHKSSDSCSGACVTMQASGSIRTAWQRESGVTWSGYVSSLTSIWRCTGKFCRLEKVRPFRFMLLGSRFSGSIVLVRQMAISIF